MRKHLFPLLLNCFNDYCMVHRVALFTGILQSHWNIDGEVDGHMSKMGMLIFDVAIMVFI